MRADEPRADRDAEMGLGSVDHGGGRAGSGPVGWSPLDCNRSNEVNGVVTSKDAERR